jgi:protein involved in polysaccharide export with SLBB domain
MECASLLPLSGVQERRQVPRTPNARASSVPPGFPKQKLTVISRLFCSVIFSLHLVANCLQAQLAEPASPALQNSITNKPSLSFSGSSPDRLADWQKRLTVGPGDVLDISLYGQADSGRQNLSIGPDGRLNYLEARDVMAAGLTIDELRAKFEEILSKYYRASRVVIIPTAYHSKKYFLLGNTVQKGMFPLNQPTTIVEAIAKAGGFATSVQQRNTLMLADLSRSFLIRKNQDGTFGRAALDFEALFLRGDLTANQQLAPDDYLYFPPLDLQEVYVLGEVASPGVAVYTPELTALRAIIARGSFTERAYKKRILIVRGSLNHPKSFIVNASDVLTANSLDFRLEARDIIYVSRKPWSKVEELLELAVLDFVKAAVVTWTGQNIGPIIKEPIF